MPFSINTILAWVCAIALAVSASLGYLLQRKIEQLGASNERLNTATEALIAVAEERKIAAQVLAARNALIASQARKLALAQEGLQKAVQANPAWSEGDVPTDIIKALPGRSGASNARAK